MYELVKTNYMERSGTKYVMLRISRKEAHELIKSLNEQLLTDNPNAGRVEPQYKTHDGKEGGFFSISVQDPMFCAVCGKDVEPFTGKTPIGRELLCGPCGEKVEKLIKKERGY